MSIDTSKGVIQVIAYLDDASRKILAAREFDSANIENGIHIVGKAVKKSLFIIFWERRIVLRNHNCHNGALSI
jgi:hypothetical protein